MFATRTKFLLVLQGSDTSMLSKISLIHGKNRNFIKAKSNSVKEFGIVHFAGAVHYDVTGFLDKNRDIFSPDFKQLIKASSNEFLKTLFSNTDLSNNQNRDTGKRSSTTLSTKFRESLDTLLSMLHTCNPFFIRCIKPNENKSAMVNIQI